MRLEQASSVTDRGGGRFVGEIPDGWQQGRGAFGGLVLATLLRAIERSEPDAARVTRSLSGDLCGPVLPGPVEIAVEVLRRGNNLSNLDARMIQGGEVQARASAVLGAPRVDVRAPAPTRPDAPDWRELPDLGMGPPVAPVFTAHLEYRSVGARPFAEGEQGGPQGFVRLREPPARLDAPTMMALLDAWWPAIFAIEGRPRPVATVSFTAELLAAPAELAPDVPLFYTGRVVAVREGFFVEFRELWSEGRLVALNQQTFAVLK